MATAKSANDASIFNLAKPPMMELLEPRLVFDASFDVIVDRTFEDKSQGIPLPARDTPLSQDHAFVTDVERSNVPPSRQEIVFIDANIADTAALLAALPANAEVHTLLANRDGAAQIAAILAGRTGIDAIHLLSHGREGSISLGTSQLTEASITGQYRQTLETIGRSLTTNGDILVYGCDVGANLRGFSTVAALAQVTGADVAASDDLTGSAAQGADWDLEISSGRIETTIIRAPDWDHILAPLLISVSGAPTVTGAGGAGTVGLWTNAGSLGVDVIDLRATVVSITGAAVVNFTLGTGDDPRVTITGIGSALIRWEVFKSGTSQTVIAIGDPNFLIRDLDGNLGVGASVEAAAADLTGLNSYTTNNPSNLILSNDGTQIRADGTVNQSAADQMAWVKFNWLNRSAWEATYFCFISASTRFYDHDGDGDFVFSNPVVVGLPQLDLDANNSSGATVNTFSTAYTENGSGVSIADPDIALSHASSTTLQGATIVLSNAQVGDLLAAGTLPSGISASAYNAVTGTITLTGAASLADYQAAIAAITFANTTDTPNTTPRAIDVFVTDGVNKSDVARTTITVTAVNDPPVAVDDVGTVTEDMPTSGNVLTGLGADTDADGDTLSVTQFTVAGVSGTFTAGSTATIPGVGTLVIASNGAWTFTPVSDYDGAIPVATYTVSDGNGGTDTATLTLTMTPVNDPPEAIDDVGSVIEDTPASGNVLTGLGADTDVDGDTLSVTQFTVAGVSGIFTAGSTATIPSVGTLVIAANGIWTFTPATNYDGPIPAAIYTVSDGNGGTDTGTLTLAITPVNDTPVVIDPSNPGTAFNPTPALDPLNIIPDIASSDGVTPASVNIASFIRDPEGQPLVYSSIGLPPGLMLDPIAGVISGVLTPSASQGNTVGDPPGTYTVVITATDPSGAFVTTSLTYTISNPAPMAADDTGNVTEDIAATGNLLTGSGVGNTGLDSDPDGDMLRVVSFTVPGLVGTFSPATTAAIPGVGEITIFANGSYSFVPASNYNGAVPVISYTISDGEGGFATATLSLTILPVNDGPIAVDDRVTAQPNSPVEISVLSTDSDLDGDVLSVTSARSDNGTVTIMPDGKLLFTPTRGFVGDAVIVYTISDGNGGTASARVIVNVLQENNYTAADLHTQWTEDRRQPSVAQPSQQGLSVLLAAKVSASGAGRIASVADRGESGDIFRTFLDLPNDRTAESDAPFLMRTFVGSSIGLALADGVKGEALWVESMFNEGRFVLKVFEKGLDGKIKLVRHTLHSKADIQWLQEMSIDLHAGLPPVNLEAVEIEVQATLSSGEVVHRLMLVEPNLGQVRGLDPEN